MAQETEEEEYVLMNESERTIGSETELEDEHVDDAMGSSFAGLTGPLLTLMREEGIDTFEDLIRSIRAHINQFGHFELRTREQPIGYTPHPDNLHPTAYINIISQPLIAPMIHRLETKRTEVREETRALLLQERQEEERNEKDVTEEDRHQQPPLRAAA
jgi:hypothetical protein